MKYNPIWAHVLLLGAPLTLLAGAYAAPKLSRELNESAKSKIKVPVGDIKIASQRTAVGERYKLWMSINPTDCNDPMYPGKSNPYDDKTFECYGQLLINGTTYWSIPKEWANNGFAKISHRDLPDSSSVNPRNQGYRLNRPWKTSGSKGEPFEFSIYSAQPNTHKVNISLKLYDRDNPGFYDDGPYNTPPDRNDDVIGDYKINLDISKLGKGDGRYYWFWKGKDESGNAVGTNLYLFVEHAGTIYDSGKKPSYEQPPVIDKKFPGKIPGPGPVIKGRR
ncbi:hypothetical protein EON83_03120 [bacterium]|nr:MAG: hypothetical protein EON83_03120 [bacterium]